MGEGIERLIPLSRAGDSMLCARLQAVLRGATPSVERCLACDADGVHRWGGCRPKRVYDRARHAQGPMSPCASLTIGLASEATLHGRRPLLTSRGRYCPGIRSLKSAPKLSNCTTRY